MHKEAPAELLQKVAIFGALRADTIAFLLSQSSEVAVAAGECFMRENEPGNDFYVLERGAAEAFKEATGPSGETIRVRLRDLGPGDCFGETAILAIMPRSATVAAVEDCVALKFRSTDLLALYEHDLEQFSVMLMNLAREVARRLWLTSEMLFWRIAAEGPSARELTLRRPADG